MVIDTYRLRLFVQIKLPGQGLVFYRKYGKVRLKFPGKPERKFSCRSSIGRSFTMPKAFVEGDTFLKKRLLPSQELPTSEKLFLQKGREFFVTKYAPSRNQHLILTLASPLPAMDGTSKLLEVYAYDPHIRIEGEEAQRVIRLNVPYRSQMDNEQITGRDGRIWYSNRQCNTTCNTMLADFLLAGSLSKWAVQNKQPEPESVFMRLVRKHGDTVDHDAQTQALRELKIESYFSRTLSIQDVLRSLRAGIPVVVGFAYKVSGHICLVVGHDPVKKHWLVHDPYGIRHGITDNYDVGVRAAFDQYSYDVFQQLFLINNHPESGWGRIVTSVRGKPTGLPTGL